IQAFAIRLAAVELERSVGFDEMIMAAHLHRTIAEVRDAEFNRRAPGVEFDFTALYFTRTGNDFIGRRLEQRRLGNRKETSLQRQSEISVLGGNRMMHRDELG